MTASLFLDPADNYIKVNYFPEEPKRGLINYVYHSLDDGGWMVTVKEFPHTTGSGNTKKEALKSILENIELIKKFEEGKYQDALTAARASAVKVKDQEQAKRLILNQYEPEKCKLGWCWNGDKRFRCMNQCAKYNSIEPNILYTISGLTFKVEVGSSMQSGFVCTDDLVEFAILELPSYNNTPDNSKEVENVGITVPIEQQESQTYQAMKTLQECKETVAKNHGFSSWIRLYQQNTGLELKAMDEIAELYAQSRTEELQKQVEELKAFIKLLVDKRELMYFERDEVGEKVWFETAISHKAVELISK